MKKGADHPLAIPQHERDRILDHVLREVAAGRAAVTVLRDDPDMCSTSAFFRWIFDDKEIEERFARARELGVEARLAQVDAIVDGEDVVSLEGLSGDALARAMWRNNPKMQRLRYDARIKMAQLLKPRKYGPRLDLTTDGKSLGAQPDDDAAARAHRLLTQVDERLQRTAPRDIDLDDATKALLS